MTWCPTQLSENQLLYVLRFRYSPPTPSLKKIRQKSESRDRLLRVLEFRLGFCNLASGQRNGSGYRAPYYPLRVRPEKKNRFNLIPVSPCEETDTNVNRCKGLDMKLL